MRWCYVVVVLLLLLACYVVVPWDMLHEHGAEMQLDMPVGLFWQGPALHESVHMNQNMAREISITAYMRRPTIWHLLLHRANFRLPFGGQCLSH